MAKHLEILLVLTAIAAAQPSFAEIVTARYEAEAVTVVEMPFGMEVPRLTVVTGYFTFDTGITDDDPDPMNGSYKQVGDADFVAQFLDAEIRGSSTSHYQVQLAGNPSSDTFRVRDGPNLVFGEDYPDGGTMTIDGVPDEDIELFFAATDDVFDHSQALIDPFPLFDYGFLGTPHTFSLEDDQGIMLLQITEASEVSCGDANGDGDATAGDALQALRTAVGTGDCLLCACDTDKNKSISTADALKVLRYAVGQIEAPTCSHCL